MTKNLCIDQLRKKKHLAKDENIKEDSKAIDDDSPYELMQRRESESILIHIIGNLPEMYRSAIRMRDIEGLSYEEIVEKTGQNINTLRVTLSRARKLIRDEFNKYQYERRGIKEAARKVL
jgi:RNA polymerase sigma-70 factor, ECF subfamily